MTKANVDKTLIALRSELSELKTRLYETEETLRAIRNGEVDAIVVSGQNGEKIFSLESSETPYRIIIEEMDEGAVTISSDGIILYCNQRFADIISFPIKKITGSDFAEFIPENDRSAFRKLVTASMKKPVRGQVTCILGKKIVHLRLSMVRLPENIEGDICIMVSDITEINNYQRYLKEIVEERTSELEKVNNQLESDIRKLKTTEKALQQSEERYSLAVSAAFLGTWDYLRTHRGWRITWSDQMYGLYGLLPDKKMTMELMSSWIHPDDIRQVETEFMHALETHTQYDCEYRVVWPDKTVHWIHATGKVMYREAAGIILRITGIARDVTSRKIPEIKLKESEERYRLLSDTMMQGVIHRDGEGKIIFVNPAGERILGRSSDELIGRKFGYEVMHEDGTPLKEHEHPAMIALRTGHYSIGTIIKIFNPKENKYRWLSVDTLPLFHGDVSHPYQVYSVFEDITSRKKTEKELHNREQLFRLAFDEGAVPMTITSKKGEFLKVNHAFCKLTGYTQDELKEITYQQLTWPDDLEASLKGREELERSERSSFRLEKRYIRKDGRTAWVSISTAPVRNEDGQLDFFVTHVQDINKRKVAENRLKESKDRFRQLANSIPQLAWIARSDGYVFWFNQRWYEYTGKTNDEMTGWGWLKVYDPDIRDEVAGKWKMLVATGKPFEMISPLCGRDGIYREYLTKTIPIRDKKGQVEQWFGTHTDISDLKKVENELKLSRERLGLALENGRIGTWEWDPKTSRMTLDARMERMFGIEPGTFGGTFEDFEKCVHEEDLPHIKKAIQESLDLGKPYETVFRTRPVNGNSNFISSKALITKVNDGKDLSLSGVCFDVTSMKKGAEQVLLKLTEELLRSNTDLQQFAYVASHDLQEPLRMVSSFTQLLQLRYRDKLDKDGIEYIRYAVEGSKRMYELLNGLLAYSRIQTKGKEFLNVDMNEILGKVKENLSLIIEETGAEINSSKLPVISADENQMIQLVQNLIENSIKFRRGIPEITLSAISNDDQHVFSLQDTGIGLEPQYYERIFRIFQRLHRANEYEGTGIGLAICRRIVERHGGRIWVESKIGEGSTFYFSIPISIPSSLKLINQNI